MDFFSGAWRLKGIQGSELFQNFSDECCCLWAIKNLEQQFGTAREYLLSAVVKPCQSICNEILATWVSTLRTDIFYEIHQISRRAGCHHHSAMALQATWLHVHKE
jgi:hypothetical protein